jgi:hypothetical protein
MMEKLVGSTNSNHKYEHSTYFNSSQKEHPTLSIKRLRPTRATRIHTSIRKGK